MYLHATKKALFKPLFLLFEQGPVKATAVFLFDDASARLRRRQYDQVANLLHGDAIVSVGGQVDWTAPELFSSVFLEIISPVCLRILRGTFNALLDVICDHLRVTCPLQGLGDSFREHHIEPVLCCYRIKKDTDLRDEVLDSGSFFFL